jgi:hypothetical protein
VPDQRDHALPLRRRAGHLPAEHERDLEARQIGVLALVGVGVVDARARHLDQHLAVARLGLREVRKPKHLGPAELLDLHRSHGAMIL